ncbi:MAG: KpsF/GutQ family sugar-phosphate isomerase [Planctomycetaceae bacterium]|nr:KpsF/GutQ family sugar-phosphate isomerase [Planctomycetaceae bacterium]
MTTEPPRTSNPASTDEVAFLRSVLDAERDTLTRISDRLGDEAEPWNRAIGLVAGCDGHVVVSGMGKSGLVGAKISATLSSLGRPSHTLHPAEAVHGDLGRIRRGDVALLLSYSGETEEIVALASILKADKVPCIGISRDASSTLGKLCPAHLALGDITEACPLNLAPTASTTAMMAVGDALAIAASRRRDFDADAFHRHHPGGMLGAGLRPIVELLRFRVGENVAVVPDTGIVRDALVASGDGRRTGAILLVDTEGRLSGIFTDGDLRRLVNHRGAEGLDSPIADIMTRQPRSLTDEDLVRDAVRLVRERRVDEIPVVDADGRPVGVLDVQDLVAMKVVRD